METLSQHKVKYKLNPLSDNPGWFQLECLTTFTPHFGGTVLAGTLGGLIQSPESLSQEDNSWIGLGAHVDKESRIGAGCLVEGRSDIRRSHIEQRSRVSDSRVFDSRLDHMTTLQAELTRVRAGYSHIFHSDLSHCNVLHSTIQSRTTLDDCEISSSNLISCGLYECEVIKSELNNLYSGCSVWTEANACVVLNAFRYYKASIQEVGMLGVGCQSFPFETWLDHEQASMIMMKAAGVQELPGEWERFEMTVRLMKLHHDDLVATGKLKSRAPGTPVNNEVQTQPPS